MIGGRRMGGRSHPSGRLSY